MSEDTDSIYFMRQRIRDHEAQPGDFERRYPWEPRDPAVKMRRKRARRQRRINRLMTTRGYV